MKENNTHLYLKDARKLQIPYGEYADLIKTIAELQRLRALGRSVLADLRCALGADTAAMPEAKPAVESARIGPREVPDKMESFEKVSIEFGTDDPVPELPAVPVEPRPAHKFAIEEIPPIKKDIAEHFNKADHSGRLFNVFKQYYTFLNEACGGTVRVTLKDGFCSLWNYNEWEEFAFVDIFEGSLRISINPRYTDELKSMNLCEVPRLLANRLNLICLRVDDLSNRVLDVLARAFSEVGLQAT